LDHPKIREPGLPLPSLLSVLVSDQLQRYLLKANSLSDNSFVPSGVYMLSYLDDKFRIFWMERDVRII